jgi:diadenosine tetraphosphatase ApaH/serine/threonine PP2A family protein phosphatase
MKTAILSDIHGNLEALEAVLKDIDKSGGVGRYWCLGDTVDYGPDPHQCLERVRQLGAMSLIGNHDAAVAGKFDYHKEWPEKFIEITRWTQENLTAEDKMYLAGLPIRIETGQFTLVHASPREPIFEYILTRKTAQENLFYFKTPFCLVGHSHLPSKFNFNTSEKPLEAVAYEKPKPPPKKDEGPAKDGSPPKEGGPFSEFAQHPESLIKLGEELLIINPGAVGLQRDKDPRAAYAVYNEEDRTIELRRVEYDVESTRQKMLQSTLPEWLREKLAAGT